MAGRVLGELLGRHRTVGEDRISRDADMIPCSDLVPDAAHRGERSPTLEHEREIDRRLTRPIRRERSARLYGDRDGNVVLGDQCHGCDSFRLLVDKHRLVMLPLEWQESNPIAAALAPTQRNDAPSRRRMAPNGRVSVSLPTPRSP